MVEFFVRVILENGWYLRWILFAFKEGSSYVNGASSTLSMEGLKWIYRSKKNVRKLREDKEEEKEESVYI